MSGLMPPKFRTPTAAGGVDHFDSAAGDAANKLREQFSEVDERALLMPIYTLRSLALAALLKVIDGMDAGLDDDVPPSEFFDGAMLEAVDHDEDGEVDPMIMSNLSAHVADAMESLGVPKTLITDVFSDQVDVADAAIESMVEKAMAQLPAEGDALDEFIKVFIYGFDTADIVMDDTEDQFDSAGGKKKLTAGKNTRKTTKDGHSLVYKAVKAVRNGKVTVVNKRISGKVVLSAKQKAALRKAGAKAHTASAIKRQLRSLSKGISAGLYQAKGLMAAGTARYKKRAFGGI